MSGEEDEYKEICSRCGRKLKHPKWLNGNPYGKICVKKVGKETVEGYL